MIRLRQILCRGAAWAPVVLLLGCGSDPGYKGLSSKDWIEELHSVHSENRVAAATALGKILLINPRLDAVVDALSKALADTSDDVRLTAASALTAKGVNASGALGGFHSILHDSAHAEVRETMAFLVGTLGASRGRMLIGPLAESLSDPDAGVRAAAVESLGMLGPLPVRETDAIARLASDASSSVRKAALQSLLNLHASAGVTLRAARRALGDSIASVRAAAAYALWPLGRKAAPATPELILALRDEDSHVREAAAFALGGIGPPAVSAKPGLSRLLADTAKSVASQAADALAAIEGRPVQPKPYAEPSAQDRCRLGSTARDC